jgi:DNA-binding MarR family transcriptional regulator
MSNPPEKLLLQSIDRFWETIPPVWNAVRSHLQALATEKFDITVEQFHILRHVRKGRCSVSELADVKRISRPAISQGVETLVRKGLISRKHSPDDRRYVQLELTAEGKALLDGIFGQARGWMKTRLASLSAAELETIISALPLLKGAFDEPKA